MAKICYGCFKTYSETERQCPYCGHNNDIDRDKYPLALPNGALLNGRYKIGKVLGQGGFGITYLAQDYSSKGLVAIKEYFPDSLVTRNHTLTVRVSAGDKQENFEYGKTLFLQEARTLAVLKSNPHVVKIHEYYEENGTAYFSMEYIHGADFLGYIAAHGGRLSFDETMEVMLPVMDALSAVHEKGLVHRDVTPDNIRISDDGQVILIDFGAARYSVGDVTKSLEVVLKHGFAPVEQYSRHGKQGPFTDVYALSATIYYAITGKKPMDSVDRWEEDLIALPSALGAEIESGQEEALMHGLAVRSQDRYQTIAELRDALLQNPEIWKEEEYQAGKKALAGGTIEDYQAAKDHFLHIGNYKNAEQLLEQCSAAINQAEKKGQKKQSAIILSAVGLLVILLGVGTAALLFSPSSPAKGNILGQTKAQSQVETTPEQTVETVIDREPVQDTPQEDAETERMIELMLAVEYGDVDAMKQIGDCYQEGKCVEINYQEALFWYLKASERGNAAAMKKIAECYENGLGVEPNAEFAQYWNNLSSDYLAK